MGRRKILTSPFPVKLSFSSSGSRYFNDDVDAAVRLNAKSNGSAESISADAVEACAREHTNMTSLAKALLQEKNEPDSSAQSEIKPKCEILSIRSNRGIAPPKWLVLAPFSPENCDYISHVQAGYDPGEQTEPACCCCNFAGRASRNLPFASFEK
jgi:hypothetical protein